jgi:DNA polymerase elongation subunit (family B)
MDTKRIVKIKKTRTVNGRSFRLVDFNVYDGRLNLSQSSSSSADDDSVAYKKRKPAEQARFIIQMFGINERGETFCVYVNDFAPFFFAKVGANWTKQDAHDLLLDIREKVGKFHSKAVTSVELIDARKLYGFTAGRKDKFVKITFVNTAAFNKAKNLWFVSENGDYKNRKLCPLVFKGTPLELYESFIPPLLRYFHIQNVSPSGWVFVKTDEASEPDTKSTTCNYEYVCKAAGLISQPEKVTRVPYKICSFDIEASSSHGDFPLPKKTYKRLAMQLVDVFARLSQPPNPAMDASRANILLKKVILTAFGMDRCDDIDLVYPKRPPTKERVLKLIEILQTTPLKNAKMLNDEEDNAHLLEIDQLFESIRESVDQVGEDGVEGAAEMSGGGEEGFWSKSRAPKKRTNHTALITDLLLNEKEDRDHKIEAANDVLTMLFPRLEGDKVTFIGSTFLRYGEPEPYLNHCLVLGTCDPVDGAEIQSVSTEADLLIEWKNLIQRENPDIIIGYNIFGFDYEFMFRRAEENQCEREFLKLSRKEGEVCAKPLRKEGPGGYGGGDPDEDCELEIENPPPIKLATGEYNMRFVKMTGRLQIDLFIYFRRTFNLPSYKLDDVAGQNISDDVKKVNHVIHETHGPMSELYSGNLKGLHVGDYIHIEISGFTSDYYKNGQKFKVLGIDSGRQVTETVKGKEQTNSYNVIMIAGHENLDMTKHIKWGMAKDDVTPQDIFRLSNGSSADRAIVAKYCIQDCNLVQHLMNKIDLITGFSEMSTICSVPISFLITRGQSIKLTSFVAKKCREKNTLMPDQDKCTDGEKYEGAIVLPPKCAMYMDNPVACVDYSSLYPSSMISQNFSHDSKVWVKEYDLTGKLIGETGEKDADGTFIYDNLPGYKYIDIEFDNFKYLRNPANPKSKEVKTKVGKFVVRWAQLPEGEKSILPAILEQLLGARASTRKMMKSEKDPFMQNILEKRQLGYKETANSLYGQCGAPVSPLYEKDVAACTTATGRMMIIYAKRIVEEVYGDLEYDTEVHGPVKCKAEYIYGDSVANYTPVYIRSKDAFSICTIEDLAVRHGGNNWVKCSESGKQDKEFCELSDVETWTDKGWTKLHRVIRHELASHKKMIRVLTHTGLVDVTDDHSLLTPNENEVSPKDVKIGSELLHHSLPIHDIHDDFMSHYKFDVSQESFEIKITSHIEAAKIFWKASANGWSCEISEDGSAIVVHQNHNYGVLDIAIKKMHEIPYSGYVYDLTTNNHHFAAGIGNMIVHNTDSVFFTFNLEDPKTGAKILGKPALEMTIEIAQDAAQLCSKYLKPPMELSYEKTLMPFILLSKKRYVGTLYETDPNKGKMKYMGLAIKRRDSCDYLKDTYGAVLNILMKDAADNPGGETKIQKAIAYLNNSLENLIAGNVSMDKLMLTSQLRGYYKNPDQIAHNVLANRIGKRDPGNKPKPGDRMKYLVVCNDDAKAKKGERIETPEYIMEKKLPIDYLFYIESQLMEPFKQLFGLAIEEIWELQKKTSAIKTYRKDIAKLEEEFTDLETFMKKKEKHCSKKIEELLFKKYLTKINNDKRGLQPISAFFITK